MCNHSTPFAPKFITPVVEIVSFKENKGGILENLFDNNTIVLEDFDVTPSQYLNRLVELAQHKSPSIGIFITKPGFWILFAFWFSYCTSVIFYVGKDALKRLQMTKEQNRDDLAELKDSET
jgi:hypothetical protein